MHFTAYCTYVYAYTHVGVGMRRKIYSASFRKDPRITILKQAYSILHSKVTLRDAYTFYAVGRVSTVRYREGKHASEYM